MRQCTHVRAGIVTTHPGGYVRGEAHAARNCCGRQACIDAAVAWCASKANRTAYWLPDLKSFVLLMDALIDRDKGELTDDDRAVLDRYELPHEPAGDTS